MYELTTMKSNNFDSFCILTYPLISFSDSYFKIINNFLEIMMPISDNIYLITGNFPHNEYPNLEIANINYKFRDDLLTKFFGYFILQLRFCILLFKIRNKYDVCFIFAGYELFLPFITLLILGKKPVLTALATKTEYHKSKKSIIDFLYTKYIMIIEKIIIKLAYKIILESPHVSDFMGINKYDEKLLWGHLFILDDLFTKKVEMNKRANLIGYIGRFSHEKGILNFVKSIPLIKNENVSYLICGEGSLEPKIHKLIKDYHLENKVEIKGWIDYKVLPKYLNSLKLIVLPSYTEGLPNVMLESMACGTPVLATRVGGVPDL